MFSKNPNQLGHLIVGLAMVVAFLPCGTTFVFNTSQGQLSSNIAAIMTRLPYNTKKLSFQESYFVLWAILTALMLGVALICIPYHLKKQKAAKNIQAAEANRPKKQ